MMPWSIRSLHHVVCTRLHGYPALVTLSPFHFQQPSKMNDSVCTQCLRADVSGVHFTVNVEESEAPLLDRFLAPEWFDFQILHMARSASRHHATCSVRGCVYSERHRATALCREPLHTLTPEKRCAHFQPSLVGLRWSSIPLHTVPFLCVTLPLVIASLPLPRG